MLLQKLRKFVDESKFYSLSLRSPSAVQKWQDTKLRAIVRHAYKNVPLWGQLFRQADIDPEHFKGTNDLCRLPIITKKTFSNLPFEHYIDGSRHVSWHTERTSGSTGEPFEFVPSDRWYDRRYNDFSRFRFLARSRPLHKLSDIRSVRIKITPEQAKNRLFIHVADFLRDPHEAARKIAEFGPDVIEACPSLLLIAAQNAGRFRVPYAVSVGETLSGAARSLIASSLGCEVYDRYGAEEFATIAMECSEHDGLHVHPESVYVEIVDDAGNPVPDGESGRAIVTSLLNFNMPFIRYDLGDCGIMTHEPCACGLRTARIRIDGRASGSLQFGDRVIHRMEFETALSAFMHTVLQFQVVKDSEAHLIVRVVAGPAFDDKIARQIGTILREYTPRGVTVAVTAVKEITQMPNGKSQTIVDASALRSR